MTLLKSSQDQTKSRAAKITLMILSVAASSLSARPALQLFSKSPKCSRVSETPEGRGSYSEHAAPGLPPRISRCCFLGSSQPTAGYAKQPPSSASAGCLEQARSAPAREISRLQLQSLTRAVRCSPANPNVRPTAPQTSTLVASPRV